MTTEMENRPSLEEGRSGATREDKSLMQESTIAARLEVGSAPRLILPEWLGQWPGLAISVDWPRTRAASGMWVSSIEMDCTAPGETNAWELTVYHATPDAEYPREMFADGGLSELRAALTAILGTGVEWDSVYGPKLVLCGWACVYGRWEQ